MNVKFEENKIKRALLQSGEGFAFYRPSVNEFGEPVDDLPSPPSDGCNHRPMTEKEVADIINKVFSN